MQGKSVILSLGGGGGGHKELLEFKEEEKNIAGRAGKLALHLQKWEK